MKITTAITLASFGVLATALPSQTTQAPAVYGGDQDTGYGGSNNGGNGGGNGAGNGGGNGGGSVCYTSTYSWTSSGWTEYPTTIARTGTVPYTKVLTLYQTIETEVSSSYVTTISTKVPTKVTKEVLSTSTGHATTTQAYVTKIKTSWTSSGPKVTSTCNAGGGGSGSGGY